jgi:hypothetical protein
VIDFTNFEMFCFGWSGVSVTGTDGCCLAFGQVGIGVNRRYCDRIIRYCVEMFKKQIGLVISDCVYGNRYIGGDVCRKKVRYNWK